MGIGRVLGAAAPIAAGYFTGGTGTSLFGLGATGSAITAGALTGAGIAALSGQDMLGGAFTGGLGGLSGGAMAGAAGQTAAGAGKGLTTTAEANKAAIDAVRPQGMFSSTAGVSKGIPMTAGAPTAGSTSGMFAGQAGVSQPIAGATPGTGGYVTPPTLGERTTAAFKEPGTFLENLGEGNKALGAGKLGLTGLGVASSAGAFDPDMPEYGDDPMSKYDPKRRLNLGAIDTGLKLNRDTGLRLLAEGGTVRDRSYYGITPQYNTVQPQFGSGMPYGGQARQVRVPVKGIIDVGGKFKATPDGDITDVEYEDRFKYVTEGTTAEKNQEGGEDMDSINKAASAGKPSAGAIAALAQGFAKQQTQAPTQSQTLGLEALEAGGYLETGGEVGDGMSDEIEATIEGTQEARLSDGEFVIPADVVSHLGNGSSDAGARRLYEMMDKVRMARTGTKKQGKEIKPERYMPT